MYSAGHDVVACPFRRTLEQDRRLNLQKFAGGEKVADEADDLMTQGQVVSHARSTQIQVAILETQRLVYVICLVGDIEWRRLGWVEDVVMTSISPVFRFGFSNPSGR